MKKIMPGGPHYRQELWIDEFQKLNISWENRDRVIVTDGKFTTVIDKNALGAVEMGMGTLKPPQPK